MIKNTKIKISFLILNIVILLLSIVLIPINIYAVNFPEWVVVLLGVVSIVGFLAFVFIFQNKLITKILLPIFAVIIVVASALSAYAIPYWNSYNMKAYNGEQLDYDKVVSYEQAKSDLDETMSLLKRTHPKFIDGLTSDMIKNYNLSIDRLKGMQSITVNDLRREIQSVLAPMHDAHTTTSANGYINEKFLRYFPQKQAEGYTILSVNGLDWESIYNIAKPYYCYEGEDCITIDLRRLSTLEFYKISAPYTFVWENKQGSQIVETYSKNDFVGMEEYVEIAKKYSGEEDAGTPFVYYEVDSEKSLAILTIETCNYNNVYCESLKKMFAEIKAKGIKNLAVDLRDNTGGNSMVANEFFKYLPVEEYNAGACDVRYNYFSTHFSYLIKNNLVKDLVFNGKVFVLTNGKTFSSATIFAMRIKDNKLGKIIGETSSNKANSYGDVACFYLKQTGLRLNISTKKWYRADKNNTDEYITPDLPCKSDEVFEHLFGVIE